MNACGILLRIVCEITALFISNGYAQGLTDPTKPPTISSTTSGSDKASDALSTPALQSIILPVKGKPIAVINGRQVTIGDKLDEGRVINITENSVELKGANGVRILKILPNVEKKPSVKKSTVHKRRISHEK